MQALRRHLLYFFEQIASCLSPRLELRGFAERKKREFMLDRPIMPSRNPPTISPTATMRRAFLAPAIALPLVLALCPPGAAQSQTPEPALTAEECRLLLARNAAGATSGADYVPGVSTTGKAVAPADLPPDPGVSADAGGAASAFDQVEIKLLGPIEAEGGTGIGAQLRPGTLTVNTRTGQVLLDGKPLTGGQDSTLARYCAALEKRGTR